MAHYNEDWKKSVEFWNGSYVMSEDEAKEIREGYTPDDWAALAPSPKQVEAIKSLAPAKRLLDYGCGHGWASVIAAKCGCDDILAVDVASNCEEQVNLYASVFGVADKVRALSIDPRWIHQQDEGSFDALFTSNVLDVVPEEVCDDILKGFNRVLKRDAKVIISLNFYAKMKDDPERHMEFKDDKYLFVNGVLRLYTLTDDEWKNKFEENDLIVEKLEYFAWPGETKESRRLFYLHRK